jgi:hypothetical protein
VIDYLLFYVPFKDFLFIWRRQLAKGSKNVDLCSATRAFIRSGRNVNSAIIAESHYHSEITLYFQP